MCPALASVASPFAAMRSASLIFLNDLVRNLVKYWVLVLALDSNNTSQQQAAQRRDDRCFSHRIFFLSQSK